MILHIIIGHRYDEHLFFRLHPYSTNFLYLSIKLFKLFFIIILLCFLIPFILFSFFYGNLILAQLQIEQSFEFKFPLMVYLTYLYFNGIHYFDSIASK
jgi:uncharacterized SAM-binding protein YcdF (DUF218 family)